MFDLTQPKNKLALGALGVLVFLKFVVVPLFDWQNMQLGSIANLQKRVSKSQNVIANQNQITKSQQRISKQLKAINSLFIDYKAESEFKLSMQQKVEQTIAINKLQINSSNWLPSLLVADGQLIRHQIRLSIKGNMLDFTSLITELESSKPKAELKTFNINVKGQNSERLGQVDGLLELAFYMRNSEGHNE